MTHFLDSAWFLVPFLALVGAAILALRSRIVEGNTRKEVKA